MQSFMITLLICSVTMSAIALFYMGITPLLSKRYSVASRYYTWLVVVIGLIIPFRPQFSNAIVKVDIPSNTVVPNIQIGNGTPVAAPLENVLTSALPTISLWQIAVAIWLAGMIIFLAYHVIKHYHFLKLVAHWSKEITDEQTLTLIQNLKFEMGLTKNIGLQFCDSIGSPTTNGAYEQGDPNDDFNKDLLKDYLEFGISYNKDSKHWFYNDKPIYFFTDDDKTTYFDGSVDTAPNGIAIQVIRNSNGQIGNLTEITKSQVDELMNTTQER